jgi:putative membrane protein
MKQFLINLLLTAVAVFLVATLLDGVSIDGFLTSILVALVLGLLNVIVKPILIILTIPVTIVTLGLFLLVINTAIILLADWLVSGFAVDGFWWALLFSLLLSLVNAILGSFFKSVD